MKTKRIVLTLFFISNLIFLPKICLAVAPEGHSVVNKDTKICGYYNNDYFTLLNYQPPKNWEKVSEGSQEYIKYCLGKKIEYINPRILGLNLWGYFLLSLIVVIMLGFSRLILLAFNLFVVKKRPKITKLINFFCSLFHYSLFLLYFVFLGLVLYYVSDIVRDIL